MINITAARQTGMYTLIEQNFIERMRFCSHAARVQHRSNRTFAWLRTGIHYPNVFLNLVWSRNVGYNYLGQEVDLLVNHLSQKEAPIFWALNPELPSAFHTSQRLEALGFSMESPVHGMTMLLDGANTQVDIPEELVIQRVYEPQSLEAFLGVLSARYAYSTSAAQQWQGMESRLGFGLHSIWQRYVGLWKGEPVATAAVFMGSSAAGIYHVETLSMHGEKASAPRWSPMPCTRHSGGVISSACWWQLIWDSTSTAAWVSSPAMICICGSGNRMKNKKGAVIRALAHYTHLKCSTVFWPPSSRRLTWLSYSSVK